MKLTGNEDMRVQKTIESIHSAFEQMLLEMTYRTITVKELCARARINKKTFYRYYSTLDALLAELQETYSAPYIEQIHNLRFPKDVEQITRAFLTYSAAQGKLYDRITCDSALSDIQYQMVANVMDKRLPDNDKDYDPSEWRIYFDFVTSAAMQVYRSWVKDGRRIPIDRMVNIGCDFVCRGAKSFS